MKKLITVTLLVTLATLSFAEKIGVVDQQKILANYSVFKAYQKTATDNKNKVIADLKAKELEIQKRQLELQNKGADLTDKEKTKFQSDVDAYKKYAQDQQDKLVKAEQEAGQKVADVFKVAVNKVLTANGFTLILPSNSILAGGEDVTDKVLVEMEKIKK